MLLGSSGRSHGWSVPQGPEDPGVPNVVPDTAQSTRLGRVDKIHGVPSQIVLFDTPNTSGTELIHYAYWIADDDKRVLQLGMVTSSHYMIQTYRDFDSPEIAQLVRLVRREIEDEVNRVNAQEAGADHWKPQTPAHLGPAFGELGGGI